MTADDKTALETFKVRFSDFAKQYDKLLHDFEVFRSKARADLIEKDKEIVELSARIEELEKRCDKLMIARSLAGDGEKSAIAKRRLGSIVREIDRCISLVSK